MKPIQQVKMVAMYQRSEMDLTSQSVMLRK